MRQAVSLRIPTELKPLVLDDAGIGCFPVRVVDDRVALIVVHIQNFVLKAHAAVFQRAKRISEVRVDRPGIDHLVRHAVKGALLLQVIGVQMHLDALQHPLDHPRIAADGNALINARRSSYCQMSCAQAGA